MDKQTVKNFIQINKEFFGDVAKGYLVPLKAVIAFFGIFFEFFRQMFISLMMSSDDFEKLQDIKFRDEVVSLCENGSSVTEIEEVLK